MTKTQGGVAYYFHAQGRPVKTSGYYEEKAREEEIRDRQKAMEVYLISTAPEITDKLNPGYQAVPFPHKGFGACFFHTVCLCEKSAGIT